MGIVRAYQKGDLETPPTLEVQRAASSMNKTDVKDFASTKHKGLPEKKVTKESFNEDAKMAKQSDDKLKAAHQKFSSMDKSPANTFMLKRIQREMNKRKKNVHYSMKEDYVKELEDGLVKMEYPAYDEVDKLMQKIAKENDIDTTTLHMAFKTKHLMVPDDWAKRKMMEPVMIPKTPLKSVEECWKTHKKVGMKMKGGKLVNDCRPKNEEYVSEIAVANPKRIKEPNPYSLKNKLKMVIKSVGAGPVKESGWEDIESIVFKNRANKGENTNPDFKQTVKNSKKNALKDLKDKLKNESTLNEMDNESSKRKDNKPKLTSIGDILKNISNDPEQKAKDQIAQKKREQTNEEQEPVGKKLSDVEKEKYNEKLKKASEKAPVPTNKIVSTDKLKTEGILPDIILQKKIPLGDKDNLILSAKEKKKKETQTEGSLHKWFKGSKSKDGKGGWVNVVTGGTCASDEPGEGTPKCVSSSKRASMSKSERKSAARRKKAADPGQQSKSGAAKPTYVSTDKKKKVKESFLSTILEVSDAKLFRQSDENLDKLKGKFDKMDDGPANSFMRKRIAKEVKRREKQKRKEMLNQKLDTLLDEIKAS